MMKVMYWRKNKKYLQKHFRFICFLTLLSAGVALSQPGPGDIFREFTFDGPFFSELDPNCTRDFSSSDWAHNKPRMVPKELVLDLKGAVKAQMCVEYWGGHIGTSEQKFRVNGHKWIYLPQPKNTLTTPNCYYRTLLGNDPVAIALQYLKDGKNTFQFACGPQICYNFNFGFYWIYSFTIRIYYDSSKPHPAGRITSPVNGSIITDKVNITAQAASGNSAIRQIDFIGFYEDFDWEGNGIYRQWHWHTKNGVMARHIGSATNAPYQVAWDSRWVPDQQDSIKIMARITDEKGVISTTEPVEVFLSRNSRSVKMYKPYDVPEAFGVRVGTSKLCRINVGDDPAKAIEARMVLSTWSAATDDGSVHKITLNGRTLADNFGVLHNYSFDYLPVPLEYVQKGVNEIGIYSEFEGHSLEINWPGPVLLVEYSRQ